MNYTQEALDTQESNWTQEDETLEESYLQYEKLCEIAGESAMSFADWKSMKAVTEPAPVSQPSREELDQMLEELRQENEELIEENTELVKFHDYAQRELASLREKTSAQTIELDRLYLQVGNLGVQLTNTSGKGIQQLQDMNSAQAVELDRLSAENERLVEKLRATDTPNDQQAYQALAKRIHQKLEKFEYYKEAWDDWDIETRIDAVECEVNNLFESEKWLNEQWKAIPERKEPENYKKFPHYFRPVPLNATHVDVNWVLESWNIGHTIGHAVKKLLCAGQRGVKGNTQDYREAIASIERAIELENTK